MRIYGLGAKFGRVDDKLQVFKEHGFWCMGFNQKEEYEKLISNVESGDIVFVKSYAHENPNNFYIRAIGFVSDKDNKPDTIPDEYKLKLGFSVKWTTFFEPYLHLESSDDFMPAGFMQGVGNARTRTIYEETNKEMIYRIISEMKGYNFK